MHNEESPAGGHRLLFTTENGSVRHCANHDVFILHFFDFWLPLRREDYRRFHERLIAKVHCPLGNRGLNEGGRFAFKTGSGDPAFSLDRKGMEELLWLLDSARFMLEAEEAATAGWRPRRAPKKA